MSASVTLALACRGVIGDGEEPEAGVEAPSGHLPPAAGGRSPGQPVGRVGEGGGSEPGAANPPSNELSPTGSRFSCKDPELRGRGQLAMRRLTRDEYLDSLEAVLGQGVMSAHPVERAAARIPLESPGDLVATFQNGHAFDHVEGILLTAEAVSEAVLQDPGVTNRLFGSCAGNADEACADGFLQGEALRLLRRPLDAERRGALLAKFREEGGGSAGMAWLLARILQSPEMVFHLELPLLRCNAESDVTPVVFAWDDASVFYAPNGSERTGPQARITQPGWYVWEIPGARISEPFARLSLELRAFSTDGTPLEVRVNLNDAPLISTTLLPEGEHVIEADLSLSPGAGAKVGVYFDNAGEGRALEFRSLAFVPADGETECTQVPAEHGVFTVDGWTVASRVAFALTGTGPDEELLAAAAAGVLETEEEVRPHAERLLRTDGARRQLERTLDSWLNLNAIPTPNSTIAALAGIDPEGLALEARRELIDYVAYQVFDRNADAGALMSEAIGFPRSERMATLYGSDIADGGEPVTLPRGHGGLLLRIAPLLSGQLSSSPILRGVYVRKRILCDVLPSPDFTIVNSRVEQFEAVSHVEHSTREIVTQITSEGACPTCHQQINPIGFALEAFDPLGRPREEEIVYSAEGVELARHPIDATVTEANLESGLPTTFSGAEELNAALADSAKVRACIAERMYSQARLRPRDPADACALSEIEQALREGATLRDAWIDAVVNPELFLRQVEEGSP